MLAWQGRTAHARIRLSIAVLRPTVWVRVSQNVGMEEQHMRAQDLVAELPHTV